jgi:hypothetical protein
MTPSSVSAPSFSTTPTTVASPCFPAEHGAAKITGGYAARLSLCTVDQRQPPYAQVPHQLAWLRLLFRDTRWPGLACWVGSGEVDMWLIGARVDRQTSAFRAASLYYLRNTGRCPGNQFLRKAFAVRASVGEARSSQTLCIMIALLRCKNLFFASRTHYTGCLSSNSNPETDHVGGNEQWPR